MDNYKVPLSIINYPLKNMATLALNFEDGYTRIIEGLKDEKLSNSAFAARINIPLDCNDGVCGTCKCRVRSGSFDMGDEYIEDAITDEEIAQGYALACQMVPKSDMVIDILASSAACKVKTETFSTTITALEFPSSEIVKLVLKSKDGRTFNFLAGQYANIQLPTGESRSYSFSNVSGSDTAEFLIRLLPQGAMSDFLRETAIVGDTLNLTAPFGSFYLRDINAPALFFAGGTGIAPFLAMLESMCRDVALQRLLPTQSVQVQDVAMQRLPTQSVQVQDVAMQHLPTQSVQVQDVAMQRLPTQSVQVQDVAMQRLLPTQSVQVQDVAMQRLYGKHPIQLFYGATTDENLVELDRLDSLKSKLPFDYKTCVSIEQSSKHAQGFVTQWINNDFLGNTAYDMYICGPPPMVDAVKKSINTEGVNQGHFYEEKFNPSGN
jgi:NAD(P)H-flavin reductase/ferredoxin